MSMSNPHQRRPDVQPADNQHRRLANGDVSTRILLDSNSRPSCHACGSDIALNSPHKCVTVRDDSDTAKQFIFCDAGCLSAAQPE
jgi:hypothetical protein